MSLRLSDVEGSHHDKSRCEAASNSEEYLTVGTSLTSPTFTSLSPSLYSYTVAMGSGGLACSLVHREGNPSSRRGRVSLL
jgi:hypothetical protein